MIKTHTYFYRCVIQNYFYFDCIFGMISSVITTDLSKLESCLTTEEP